ncbi:MAG TPA: alanyl-tRNA editing protein AlaXM [Candidatus Nanoarchaeia archaeon]|nr:alanyl-tRNA editing protein AlaXM [Candidatus Nanoarchaeia archaeon]
MIFSKDSSNLQNQSKTIFYILINHQNSMTQQLYYRDAYLKQCEATVKEVQENKLIVLDKTCFYPQGGGQPSDIGILTCDGETYLVDRVSKKDNKIVHEVQKLGLKPGDKIKAAINWEKRYKLMRMHTSAHVISAVMHSQASALITGNQLDENLSRIDFSLDNFNREQIEKYIEQANQYIKKNLPVKSYFISKKEAESMETLSKLAKGLPQDIKEIRIVEIQGLDKQADGGCHVKSLKEIGKILLDRLENKGSKNRRLYFKLED